ncbi:hypothetical protein BV22DRAFT_755341 [Leucogyrophana mollusca]|uniref:Uncharacterized protein n=1 Tax=Leucogyrophana mollusca TaxID=85980 RepID=A0ACB8B5Z9_9AGAM|nr:hypothetical protein BV22DRAFT_755341 [Leucogyrophana mollusca]
MMLPLHVVVKIGALAVAVLALCSQHWSILDPKCLSYIFAVTRCVKKPTHGACSSIHCQATSTNRASNTIRHRSAVGAVIFRLSTTNHPSIRPGYLYYRVEHRRMHASIQLA